MSDDVKVYTAVRISHATNGNGPAWAIQPDTRFVPESDHRAALDQASSEVTRLREALEGIDKAAHVIVLNRADDEARLARIIALTTRALSPGADA